jgi:uncharacterized RDD family membrane protein YckC
MEETTEQYTQPQPDNTEVENDSSPVPATRTRRFLNYLIDMLMQFLIGVMLVIVVVIVGGEEALAALEKTPDSAIGIPVMLLNYIFCEGLFGITVGKLVTGTKVVNEQGLAPSLGQVIGRSFSRLVPFEPLSFLAANGRGWHDAWPHTYVVMAR